MMMAKCFILLLCLNRVCDAQLGGYGGYAPSGMMMANPYQGYGSAMGMGGGQLMYGRGWRHRMRMMSMNRGGYGGGMGMGYGGGMGMGYGGGMGMGYGGMGMGYGGMGYGGGYGSPLMYGLVGR